MSQNRPCGRGLSILFRFNIESYGENTVLGDFRLRRRVCGKSEMFNRTNRLLHSLSVVSVSGRIHCGPTVFSAKTSMKDPERSMEFIVFCKIRVKHYAGILLIEFWADLMYNMDTGKAAVCEPDHCQPHRVEAKVARPAGGPVGMSQFISNISGFIPSHTAMEFK